MVKVSPMVRSFNGGVFSKIMEGRTDLDRYPASLRILHNTISAPQGPAICRSGTTFYVPVADHAFKSVLVPFVFSDEQAQTLELANDRIRFISEAGIQVYAPVAFTLSTTVPFVITSASLNANLDDDVVLNGFPADYNLNGEVTRVVAKAGNDYTLALPWPVGKANANGTVARVYHITLDYTTEEREALRIIQSIDTVYFLTGQRPRKLLRYGTYDWRLEPITFMDGPYLPINETTTKLTPSATGNAIPNMTDATTPSGTASAQDSRRAQSRDASGRQYLGRDITWALPETHAWHAFNNNDALYWSAGDRDNDAPSGDHLGLNLTQKGWLQYDFGAAVAIDGYSILAARDNADTTYLVKDFAPSKFQLLGSADGVTFTEIDSQEEYVLYDNDKSRFFELREPVAYRYYRLNIDKLTRNGPIDARVRRLILRVEGRGPASNVTAGGVIIHNATSGSTLAFDGVFNQDEANSARKSAAASNAMYVGKTYTTDRVISHARVSGSNNHGYIRGSNPTATLRLYGKNGVAPASPTDGTVLGTHVLIDSVNESTPRTITSNDTATAWEHVWVTISSAANAEVYITEVQLWGWLAVPTMTITASSTVGINRDQGFLPTDVGRLIRLKGRDNYWRAVRIEGVTNTTSVNVTLEGEPFTDLSAIKEWRLGLWSDSTGWPTCGDFFEDRLCLAGSVEFPDYFAMSMIGLYEEFSPSDEYGAVLDESAVVARLNTRKMAAIRWLAGDEKGLLIGTASGEQILASVKGDTEVVTARNLRARASTNRGSANIEPVKIDRQVLFIQRTGRTLREMAYVYEADGYKSPSMSQLASHLGVKRFKELAYAAEPHSLVWVRREDGSVVCLTYNRDENVVGWHTHDFGGLVESMCVIPAQDQMQDVLWMVINRTINGQSRRYIEVLNRFWDFDMTIDDAHYLDCALRYQGAPTKDIYGLQHLEAQEVYALADRKPQGPFTVVNGHIEIDFEASDVLVGPGFESEGETSRLENGAQDGTAIGKRGRIHNASMLLWDSWGGEIGVWTEEGIGDDGFQGTKKWTPIEYTGRRTDQLEDTALYTGEIGPVSTGSHDKKCTISFRRPKSSPLPFNVVAIMPQINKEDRN